MLTHATYHNANPLPGSGLPGSSALRALLRTLPQAVAAHAAALEAERRQRAAMSDKMRQCAQPRYARQRRALHDTIVATLRQHGRLPTVELANRMGKERSSIFRHLGWLAEEGRVVRHGTKAPEWEAA